MRHYRAVLDINHRHAPALQRLGTLLSRQPANTNGALRAWQTLLEVEPDCQTAHREVAYLLHQRGDSALLAEDHYLQALAGDAADVDCRLRLAIFYRDVIQDLDAAYFHLTAARCVSPYLEVRR
jgi:tetratricopeptide (TPR) repeat protein